MHTGEVTDISSIFKVKADKTWAFSDAKSVNHYSHGYHRYPAKFIPQIVKKLIEDYTVTSHTVADVFAGCGTTLVESKLHGRKSIGVDINPVAQMITTAKINAIKPDFIKDAHCRIKDKYSEYSSSVLYYQNHHERLDYWFLPEQKNKLFYLYNCIQEIEHDDVKNFFLCAFSHILKNCSKWLQKATKPQIDPNKKINEPFQEFERHVKMMTKKNSEFYKKLDSEKLLYTECNIKLADARSTGIKGSSVNAIITSPPYVTSYEYADIHQLTGLWFSYFDNLPEFRKNFIGTFYSNSKNLTCSVPTADAIVRQLQKKNSKTATEVSNYFTDMLSVAQEMERILAPGGVTCLVIGNTALKNVKIKSAEAFAEMLLFYGLRIERVIKRKIPNKINPTIRDKSTGQFTKNSNENKKKVYPEEFIIIARKANVNN